MKNIFQHFGYLLLLLLSLNVSAQQPAAKTLRGKVIDAGDKQPIIGASVIIQDKDGRTVRGISTDIEGNYVLPVANSEYRVAVSYLGYKSSKPLVIGDKTVINFQLESASNTMDEVVLTTRKKSDDGSGLLVDERDRTTSTFKVEAKDLEEMQAASIDQALQGRMPGVDITAVSGDPGAPMQIRIRGASTLNGVADPLIIVDGMPYETTIPSDFNFATSDENGYGALLNIAPSDIKDITVLKDAAATAIYGSKAANGVLVINTKRGVIGKPELSYTFKGSLTKQPSAIPTLNGDQYSTLILEEFYNAGRQFSINENAKQFQYDKNDPINFYNFSRNTDWLSQITQVGKMMDHSLAIRGGGEKARYIASLDYYGNTGTTKGTDYDRISTRLNLDYTISQKLGLQANFSYTHGNNGQLYSSSLRGVAYIKMPNESVYEYDAYGNLSGNYFSPASTAQGKYSSTYNPLAMAMTGINKILDERIVPQFGLKYTVSPKLTLTETIQFDIANTKSKTFLPQIASGLPFTDVSVNKSTDGDYDAFRVSSKTNAIYEVFNNKTNSLSTLLSLQSFDGRDTGQGLNSTNTASSYLQDPTNDSRTNNTSSATASGSQSRTLGAVLQLQYKLLDRYLVSGSLRADGSSKFGPGQRWGAFPGISAAWRINEEPFLKKAKFIDDLKLRLSAGQIGNAPRNNYTFYNTYRSYQFSYLGETGIISDNMELTNLKWEVKTSYNAGFDLSLWNGKLNLTGDIYRDRITDLFQNDLQIPTYNGYSTVDLNVGTMDNQGWEGYISYTALKSRNLRVDASFNIAYNENVIRKLSPLVAGDAKAKVTENGVFKTYYQVGNPLGSFYGYRYKGVYPDKASTVAKDRNGNPIVTPAGNVVYMKVGGAATEYVFQPGDTMYEDINHDGLIDYKDIVYLGNGNPKFTGGFGLSAVWKGSLRFSANFSFRQGNQLINGTKISSTNMFGFDNQSTAVLRRWRKEGDQTDIPRAMYGSGFNYLASDKFVEDGSFLRLRSATVKYDLNQSVTKKLGLKSLGIYATAEGFLTFTRYTGQDPEVGIRFSGINSVVVDKSTTPPLKVYTLGITTRL